jgi:tRNA isopentenyl-2-thiomethyl-A-37 hydroxylase MiaE
MQLTDLDSDERLALVSLSRVVARADGAVSPTEGRTIKRIAQALGEATFRELFAQAADFFPDEAALRPFLEGIQRQEARALIFQTVLELAASDEISPEEGPLVAWLEETWNI